MTDKPHTLPPSPNTDPPSANPLHLVRLDELDDGEFTAPPPNEDVVILDDEDANPDE